MQTRRTKQELACLSVYSQVCFSVDIAKNKTNILSWTIAHWTPTNNGRLGVKVATFSVQNWHMMSARNLTLDPKSWTQLKLA